MSNYKELPSQQYLQECFDYDELTGNLTWKERPITHFKNNHAMQTFNTVFVGKKAGTQHSTGYINVNIANAGFRLHRVIYKLMLGTDPECVIDHINNIKNDNRWCNLRDVSASDNSNNTLLYKNNISGVKGVSICIRGNTTAWKSKITISGNHINLGTFKNKDEAIKARLEAEEKDWSYLETKVREKDKVELTLEYLKECFDYIDGNLYWKKERPLSHFKNKAGYGVWKSKYSSTIAGTIMINKYITIRVGNSHCMAHRVIYQIHNNVDVIPLDMQIDHIDGSPENNNISNLRMVTVSENSINRKIKSSNSSGITGVHASSGGWVASISHKGNRIHLGYFKSKDAAIAARRNAEELYHSEHGRK